MVNFLLTTGPFLIPLLFLSVYSVTLIIEKGRFLKTNAPWKDQQFDQLLLSIHEKCWDKDVLGQEGHPFYRYLQQYQKAPLNPGLLQARVQAEVARLEERISYFPALANLATLLGLFGTVCGMILSFTALRAGGGADPAALAGGIAQALSATALGLVVAIPNLAAHAVFQKKIQTCILQWESLMMLTIPGANEAPLA